jgi:Flp pilus assembly protein TadD
MAKKRKRHPKSGRQKKRPVSKARKPASPNRLGGKSVLILSLLGLLAIVLIVAFTVPSLTERLNPFSKGPRQATTERLPFPPPSPMPKKQTPTFDDFVGSAVCADCHQQEYDLWKNSTHGRAGGPPSRSTVIGRFDGNPLRFKDARVVPEVKRNGEYTFTVEQDGFPKKLFRVDAVVGGGHMEGGGTQSYFSRFPDGTLRFLPFDFHRKQQVWFGEAKGARGWLPVSEEVALTDLSEWPPSRILGTEPSFPNCQQCHGSQIQTQYDLQKKRYVTRYKSLSINCESCHGPGKRHVEIAKSGKIEEVEDIGMRSLATLSKDESLKVCFQCHALKDAIRTDYLPGKNLEEHFSLKLPMLGGNPYYPDGRVRAFAYQQNHLFSDCYLNGSMTCVDCHDPHSQNYRDINGTELAGKFDNGQCTGCHASKGLAPERHSRHQPDSPGNLCTSCHMPYLQHKAMGTRIRFARSDHTIPIPRPAFDTQLGIENACKKCHQDKSIDWLQAKTEEWYGRLKPHKPIVSGLIQAQSTNDRATAARLVLSDTLFHPMAQVAGLTYFIETYLTPDMPRLESETVDDLMRLSQEDDLDLKALALAALHLARDQDPRVHSFLVDKLKSLGPEEHLVRQRWAMALVYLAGEYRSRGDFDAAIATYNKALEIRPDDATTLFNLGLTYRDMGNLSRAITYYKRAFELNPSDSMILVNLGIAYRNLGNLEDAALAYQKAIEVNPYNALAHFNLGNVYYSKDDLDDAIAAYKQAVEIDPSLALAHFFLARSYIKKQQLPEAAAALRAGLQYAPEDQDSRRALEELEAYLQKQ